MIEPIADMPSGTFGYRGWGKLTAEDYHEVLIPPLRSAIERGERIRLLFQVGPGFDGLDAHAALEDAKADLKLGVGHLSAWERIAVVSDEDWVRRSIGLFGWISPGELKLFALADLAAAEAWLTA